VDGSEIALRRDTARRLKVRLEEHARHAEHVRHARSDSSRSPLRTPSLP
jgi:hypothetical protein